MRNSRLRNFLGKTPRQQVAAAVATLRAGIRRPVARAASLAGQPLALPSVTRTRQPFYIANRPDSDVMFGLHPELAALGDAWVKHNADRNAGDLPRLYALALNLKQVVADAVPGSFAELGVYRGNTAAVLAHYARTSGREVYLFDTFDGFDRQDMIGIDASKNMEFRDTSLDLVRDVVGGDAVHFVEGHFPDSIPASLFDATFSAVHLDCDLYQPIKVGLEFFYPRLSPGGLLVIHDYSGGYWNGVQRAVDDFALTIPERPVLWPDKSGTAAIRKSVAGGLLGSAGPESGRNPDRS